MTSDVLRRPPARLLLVLLFLALNFGCDQITKILARRHLDGRPPVRLAGGLVILTYTENPGAFLSFLAETPAAVRLVLLVSLPIGVLVYLTAFLLKRNNTKLGVLLAFAALIGGGMGNVWDRVFRGGLVSDFLNFGIGGLRTGVMNTADLSIFFGLAALLVQSLAGRIKSRASVQ